MCEHDAQMKRLLGSAAMRAEPDPMRMRLARERMVHLAGSRPAAGSARRMILTLCLLVITVSAVGIAATQTGRDCIRWIFTPIGARYEFTHEATITTPGSTNLWGTSGDQPLTPQEIAATKTRHAEMDRIKQAGGGRLYCLFEGPHPDGSSRHFTSFGIEYTLADGTVERVGQGMLTDKQKANVRVDEILALRDAGAGEIISQQPWRTGLGQYTVRFTLSDGRTVDVVVNYPPGTREEREAIFAETRELKRQLRFVVDKPDKNAEGDVWGVLRYTLADGREVGIVEQVPAEAVTPDGNHVAVPESVPATAR